MSTTQKHKNTISFVDFIPAELRENKRWEIIYYVNNPYTNKLERKANRVRPLKSLIERRKLAKKMVLEINRKLDRGWNPFLNENEGKGFVKFQCACKTFLTRTEKEEKNNDKRPDTLRSYKSFIKNILDYFKNKGEESMFVIKLNNEMIRTFLDHIYYERSSSARIRNNYLMFFKTLCEFLIINK